MAIFLCLLLLNATSAHARVFDFTNVSIGTYFKGTIGMTTLKDQSFVNNSGTATTAFNKTVPYQFGGEFGVIFARPLGGFRVGLDLVSPRRLDGVSGSDAAGTELMAFDSQVTGYGPGGYIEFYLSAGKQSKGVFSFGASYLSVTILNSYRLTAAGTTAYSGIADHTDESFARAFSPQASLGWEFSAFDNVTILADLGYRYLNLQSFNFSREGTTFTGPMGAGNAAKNNAGDARTLDLSGIWTGISFRMYF